MDNELDGRLRRLEAGQADQAGRLHRLVDGQEQFHRMLTDLVQLMTEPDEEATKLQDVLVSLVDAIAVNTATLRRLDRGFSGRHDEVPDAPH